MAATKQTTGKRTQKAPIAFDGAYLLKMVLYVIVGSVWLKTSNGDSINVDIPIGLIVGLSFTLHEHFQIDRKIEYAILLAAMLFGYFAPYGLFINY